MYFIYRALLFFYLIFAITEKSDAYFVSVCSKNGGICSKNIISYAPGLHAENLVSIEKISQYMSTMGVFIRPPRKACAYVLSSVLDVIRDVLNLEVLMASSPPPPPTFLEHILRLVGWKPIEKRQLLINSKPGLMVYLIIIACTTWMFVWSFYTKSSYKNDIEWSMNNGFIFDSSLRQNLPYPLLCNECMANGRQ